MRLAATPDSTLLQMASIATKLLASLNDEEQRELASFLRN
jgi:hypothetical protein